MSYTRLRSQSPEAEEEYLDDKIDLYARYLSINESKEIVYALDNNLPLLESKRECLKLLQEKARGRTEVSHEASMNAMYVSLHLKMREVLRLDRHSSE
jgi:hypothetical protein